MCMELTVHNLSCAKYGLACIVYMTNSKVSDDHFGSQGSDILWGIDGQSVWPYDDPRFALNVIIGPTLTCGEEGVPYL
eukprot:6957770-Ditylum_brightwellii.AAC.1